MVEAAFLYLSHSDLLPYLVLSSRVCKSDSYSFKALRLAKHFKCNTLHLALQPHYQQAPPGVVAKPCSASMPEMQCDCAARAASLGPSSHLCCPSDVTWRSSNSQGQPRAEELQDTEPKCSTATTARNPQLLAMPGEKKKKKSTKYSG